MVVLTAVMDERSPLDNRSLTHTSREPEGQAWAQIGTPKANTPKAKLPAPTPAKAATPSAPPAALASAALPDQKPAQQRDEDTMSEEGRPLQVVEDAEPERLIDASAIKEEKKESEDAGAGESSGSKGGKDEKDEEKVRDRTNSNNPWMIRSRVFVGHLNTEKSSRSEIEELFKPYGRILGCSLQHGYGFVQYEEEEAAKRAIRELHGLHFKGMKLVVDKTAALKKMLGENPNAPKPWTSERGGGGGDERHKVEDMEFMRRREFYDRYARLEELERMYYDRYPPSMPPPPARDIYHDRYLDRPLPPPRDPYFERYRHAEMERSRFHHERPPMGGSVGNSFERAYYESRGERSYDRPRDDPYDRREPKDAFRDREPFERFESSRRL